MRQEAADRATEELLSAGGAAAPSESLVDLPGAGPQAASTPSWTGQGSAAYREAFPSMPDGAGSLSFRDNFVPSPATQQEGQSIDLWIRCTWSGMIPFSF